MDDSSAAAQAFLPAATDTGASAATAATAAAPSWLDALTSGASSAAGGVAGLFGAAPDAASGAVAPIAAAAEAPTVAALPGAALPAVPGVSSALAQAAPASVPISDSVRDVASAYAGGLAGAGTGAPVAADGGAAGAGSGGAAGGAVKLGNDALAANVTAGGSNDAFVAQTPDQAATPTTTTPTTTTPGPDGKPTQEPSALRGLWNDVKPYLGPAVSGGALLAAVMRGNQPVAGEKQVNTAANTLASQGQQLSSYLTSGTLPPGVQTALHRSAEAAKATTRSQYAARGMTGSDAEARDLAAIDTSIVAQGTDVAMKLMQQGVSETNLSAELYNNIMHNALAEDASLGQALSSFAQSLAMSTSALPATYVLQPKQ